MKITVNLENWPQNFCSADRGQLTPIEQYQNVLFKREDKFQPKLLGNANGSKLRVIVDTLLANYKMFQQRGIKLHSKSMSHTLYNCVVVCNMLNIPITNCGEIGERYEGLCNVMPRQMYDLSDAIEFNQRKLDRSLIDSRGIVKQFENIPTNIKTIVVASGSGVTASIVQKHLPWIHVVAVGNKPINNPKIEFHYYNDSIADYPQPFEMDDKFERRMWNYVNHNMPELLNETTLIWVTGNYNFLRFNQ